MSCTQDTIDVKKDTERADEIRAMKLAWEEAEPGRAAKAKQSRLNYLKTHMVKVRDIPACCLHLWTPAFNQLAGYG